jgi:hypothetical protein
MKPNKDKTEERKNNTANKDKIKKHQWNKEKYENNNEVK